MNSQMESFMKAFPFLHFSNWISFLGFNNGMWSCCHNLYYTGNYELNLVLNPQLHSNKKSVVSVRILIVVF